MDTLSRVIEFIFSFKAYVMLPLVILVVALVIRMKVGESLMSALRLGVGFGLPTAATPCASGSITCSAATCGPSRPCRPWEP